jgi:hypothetical protein
MAFSNPDVLFGFYLRVVATAQEARSNRSRCQFDWKIAMEGLTVKKGYDAWAEWINGRGGSTWVEDLIRL